MPSTGDQGYVLVAELVRDRYTGQFRVTGLPGRLQDFIWVRDTEDSIHINIVCRVCGHGSSHQVNGNAFTMYGNYRIAIPPCSCDMVSQLKKEEPKVPTSTEEPKVKDLMEELETGNRAKEHLTKKPVQEKTKQEEPVRELDQDIARDEFDLRRDYQNELERMRRMMQEQMYMERQRMEEEMCTVK